MATSIAPIEKKCPQCYRFREWPREFLGKRGAPNRVCQFCRVRYSNWSNKSATEKLDGIPPRVDSAPAGRMLFTLRSHNKKTGPIPLSISERGTCPSSCSLYNAGCYAAYGNLGSHWRGTGTSKNSWIPWQTFLARVRSLPRGQLWRHNEAGDLAGTGTLLDKQKLAELVAANAGRQGFTFTHKTEAKNIEAIREANLSGFTINLSADTLEEADRLCASESGPVAVILPQDAPTRGLRTPGGRGVVVCPAQTVGITCLECKLCAKPFRRGIVGFRSHGTAAALITEIVKRRLPIVKEIR